MIAKIENISELPDNLRHRYRFVLYENAVKRSQGEAILEFSSSFPNLANQSLSLSFVPATADDEALIEYFSQQIGSVPGYLVHLKAVVRSGESEIVSTTPFVMGSQLVAETTYTTPTLGEELALSYPVVGENRVFGWNLQGGVNLESLSFSSK